MYRRILVPVDGSGASMSGLQHAVGLAKDQGARLRILNVMDEPIIVPGLDDYAGVDVSPLIALVKSRGQRGLKEAAAFADRKNVPADTAMVHSRGDFVSEVILKDAKKWRADLIVMGTHGRRGLNRLLLGSDAERVLREAAVPVLLVRGDDSKTPVRKKSAGKRR